MWTNGKSLDTLETMLPFLRKLEDRYFECYPSSLEFQATTQKEFKEIRNVFRCPVWKKEYNKGTGWWEYFGEFHGVKLKIYAVKEAPKTCVAIYSKRIVKKLVPIQTEEQEVEETYISGWDCGKVTPSAPDDDDEEEVKQVEA